jgi:hypothetical protein
MTLGLLIASLLLQSPYQLWLLMAAIGLITGVSFQLGQRHVITGFGIGITLTLAREALTYGNIVKVTAPVYAAGYLFAVATTLLISYLILNRFFIYSKQ